MYGIGEARRDANRHGLSRTEEARLHAAYMAGDHSAGQRLVISFLPAILRRTHAYGLSNDHRQDMLGVAVEAFMTNLFRYDPSKGWRIWTYMRYVVKQSLSQYAAANKAFFKVTTQTDRVALANLDDEKKKLGALGRPLTGREARHVADVFGVAETIIHGLDEDMAIMRPGPIFGDRRSEAEAIDDPDRAGGHLDFERCHDHDRNMELLKVGLDSLDGRQREILTRRFKETPDTLQDLADEMNVSRERIRQIEGIALRRLRHAIEKPGETHIRNASLARRYDGTRRDAKLGGVVHVTSSKRSTSARKTRRPGARGPDRTSRRKDALAVERMRALP